MVEAAGSTPASRFGLEGVRPAMYKERPPCEVLSRRGRSPEQLTPPTGAFLQPRGCAVGSKRRRRQGHPARARTRPSPPQPTGHEPEYIFRPPTRDEFELWFGRDHRGALAATNDRGEIVEVDHCEHGVELVVDEVANAVLTTEGVFALVEALLGEWTWQQGDDNTVVARVFMPALYKAVAFWNAQTRANQLPDWLADAPTMIEALAVEPAEAA